MYLAHFSFEEAGNDLQNDRLLFRLAEQLTAARKTLRKGSTVRINDGPAYRLLSDGVPILQKITVFSRPDKPDTDRPIFYDDAAYTEEEGELGRAFLRLLKNEYPDWEYGSVLQVGIGSGLRCFVVLPEKLVVDTESSIYSSARFFEEGDEENACGEYIGYSADDGNNEDAQNNEDFEDDDYLSHIPMHYPRQKNPYNGKVRWQLRGDTLVFDGEGPMEDFIWNYKKQEVTHPWDSSALLIKKVRIESGVCSIGENALRGLPVLKRIELSDSVSNLCWCALEHCARLEEIIVDPKNNVFRSLDGVLFSKDGETLILYPENRAGSNYSVPDGVVRIEKLGSPNLRKIVFPDSVLEISSGALYECEHLTELVLPSKLKTVEKRLFCENRFLTRVELPGTLQFIEQSAFKGCTNLRELIFDGTQNQWDEVAIDPENGELYSGRVHVRFSDGSSILLPRKCEDPFGHCSW